MTELAEKDNIFIISPNGKAYRSKSLWGSSKIIEPGSNCYSTQN